jgi:hypothetical protein
MKTLRLLPQEKQLKATTLARYKELLIRIDAALSNMKLSAIQSDRTLLPHHLMAFYDNPEESGIRQDIKYTPLPAFPFREQFKRECGSNASEVDNRRFSSGHSAGTRKKVLPNVRECQPPRLTAH